MDNGFTSETKDRAKIYVGTGNFVLTRFIGTFPSCLETLLANLVHMHRSTDIVWNALGGIVVTKISA